MNISMWCKFPPPSPPFFKTSCNPFFPLFMFLSIFYSFVTSFLLSFPYPPPSHHIGVFYPFFFFLFFFINFFFNPFFFPHPSFPSYFSPFFFSLSYLTVCNLMKWHADSVAQQTIKPAALLIQKMHHKTMQISLTFFKR